MKVWTLVDWQSRRIANRPGQPGPTHALSFPFSDKQGSALVIFSVFLHLRKHWPRVIKKKKKITNKKKHKQDESYSALLECSLKSLFVLSSL